MIDCKLKVEGNRIDVFCINKDISKSIILEIFDMESNLKLCEFIFDIIDVINIWNTLTFDPFQLKFFNGFKIKLTNLITKEIEFQDILLIRPYTKTKFIDENNLLTRSMSEVLHNNFIFSFEKYKDDCFDIKNSEVLIDLGSSIGLFTAYAIEQNPNIKSVCVEMIPNFHKICSDTFKDNPNIHPINAAIYKNSNEIIEFKSISENLEDLGNTIVMDLYNEQVFSLKIKTISIEDIIKTYNIDRISLLKVDIEGYEYELFENMSDEILDKIDKIFLEFHKVLDNERKLILINRLMRKGFKIRLYDGDIDFYNTVMFSLFFTKNK